MGALTVLAISLNDVPFREAQHFSQGETQSVPIPAEDVTQILAQVPLWKQLMLWGLIALLIILVALLLSPEARKRLFRLAFRVAFTVWAVYFLLKNYGRQLFAFGQSGVNASQASDASALPLPSFEPPQVSPAFSYLISFAFALLFLIVLWVLYRGWKKYVSLNNKPLDEIAKIARSSLHDLSLGMDSSDVIINCYLRMSEVVSNKRHLQRGIAMTPHEFALRLEQSGLPSEAVTRLTRLFEGVRYGNRKSGPKDINEAVSCLTTILHHCGETV